MFLNITGLVADRNLGQSREINEGQGEDIGGVYAKVDGLRGDACILARLGFGVPDDLVADFVEVVELLSGEMEEFTPLIRVGCFVGGFLNSVCW